MRAGIIGASGYTGAELMRLLHGHPLLEVSYITAGTYAGKRVSELYPQLSPYSQMVYRSYDVGEALESAELFFICLPHGESMLVVPELLQGRARVVDLSADFRLASNEAYRQWYGLEHSCPDLLARAVYGLPEIKRDEVRGAELVAVPGCYPTASILALAPLLRDAGLADLDQKIVIDAKSGVSGAGRGLTLETHFPQCEGSVKPYNVGRHRHLPEIEQFLSELARDRCSIVFAPHLVPMSRGILVTAYVRLKEGRGAGEIRQRYEEFYREEPFVLVLDEGEFPQTKAVMGTNCCHLGVTVDGDGEWVVVASAIDNLVKGASGQAVQCANIMLGWDETTGLEALGLFP